MFRSLSGLLFIVFIALGAGSVQADSDQPNPRIAPRILGDADAKVHIIEFSSMTCPHCARFHTDVLPALKEKFIDTGKAKLEYRDFPLDGTAGLASMIARCLPEDRFFPFIDILFKEQAKWAKTPNPRGELMRIAKFAGLSEKSFEQCYKDEALLTWIVENRKAAIEKYKVESTPTFVINGTVVRGAESIEKFTQVINDALGE